MGPFLTFSFHLITVTLLTKLPVVHSGSFTDSVLSKLDSFGTIMVEDLSNVFNKSVASVQRIASCPFGECCNAQYITANFSGLRNNFKEDLFGQHLVSDIVVNALETHYNQKVQSGKPLVIMMQGQSGTGKTYVADKIATFTYKKGKESTFVRHFVGRNAFPLAQKVDSYKEQIAEEVEKTVKLCSRSMFIFDEVDKLPERIFDNISSMLNHYTNVNGVDYRQSTFIFISNSFGVEIAEQLRSLEQSGMLRDDTKSTHFEKDLKIIAFNSGGLQSSSIISEDLIDHYVPFLPLEKKHVAMCVRSEFRRHGFHNVHDDVINRIASDSTTYKDSYSMSGCKRIDKSVAYETSKL